LLSNLKRGSFNAKNAGCARQASPSKKNLRYFEAAHSLNLTKSAEQRSWCRYSPEKNEIFLYTRLRCEQPQPGVRKVKVGLTP
jgi:hypothetical protein